MCLLKASCLPQSHPAVKRGDRVAQLILERIATPEVVEVESLDGTVRGAGGYGSTGVGS
jgi:dUTP pyrophosphatase